MSKSRKFISVWRDEGLVPAVLETCEFLAPPGYRYHFRFLKTEYESYDSIDISLPRRLELLRQGFHSSADLLYDFDRYDVGDFLPDFHRLAYTRRINEPFCPVSNNKFVFHQVFSRHTDRVPDLYGVVVDGQIYAENGASLPDRPAPPDLLDRYEAFVVKPISGGGGEDVYICRSGTNGCEINGDLTSRSDFVEWMQRRDEFIVTEYIDQDGYAAELYPETPNTIRLVTMLDPDTGEPFIVEAEHRIGTSRSGGVDNVGKGGLSAEIDADGELVDCIEYPHDGELNRHDVHPDTGARITGTRVPNWDTITAEVLELAATFSYIPYIGWDVLPTSSGYWILEINSFPDLAQYYRPILIDERARRFFKHHGVV